MRTLLAICCILTVGLVVAGWGWLATAGDLAATRAERDLAQEAVEQYQTQQTRDADTMRGMAAACAAETSGGFDTGYRLGVARCGLQLD